MLTRKDVRKEVAQIEIKGETRNSLIWIVPNFISLNTNSLIVKSIIKSFITYVAADKRIVPIRRKVMKLHLIVRKLRNGQTSTSTIPPIRRTTNRYIAEEGS